MSRLRWLCGLRWLRLLRLCGLRRHWCCRDLRCRRLYRLTRRRRWLIRLNRLDWLFGWLLRLNLRHWCS